PSRKRSPRRWSCRQSSCRFGRIVRDRSASLTIPTRIRVVPTCIFTLFFPYTGKDQKFRRLSDMRELFHSDSAAFTFPYRVDYAQPRAVEVGADELALALRALPPGAELVCLCIGGARSTRGALGPLVGTRLEKRAPPSR